MRAIPSWIFFSDYLKYNSWSKHACLHIVFTPICVLRCFEGMLSQNFPTVLQNIVESCFTPPPKHAETSHYDYLDIQMKQLRSQNVATVTKITPFKILLHITMKTNKGVVPDNGNSNSCRCVLFCLSIEMHHCIPSCCTMEQMHPMWKRPLAVLQWNQRLWKLAVKSSHQYIECTERSPLITVHKPQLEKHNNQSWKQLIICLVKCRYEKSLKW